ncbi:barstar family protein [Planococcus sp. YIM B11945]|uniref:barstar family protein n=1 Tax=Planococcus sp. YIM B11945 TaxID=3435410 RepID=UPI003D7D679A
MRNVQRQASTWKKMMGNGSVIMYSQTSILEKEIRQVKAEGFEVVRFDCAEWDEEAFHKEAAKALGFPAYYGENLNAFKDCLSDLEPKHTGILLVFNGFDKFLAQYHEVAVSILDIIHWNSWEFLLEGKALLSFIQSNDPEIEIRPIGGMSPQWNGEE